MILVRDIGLYSTCEHRMLPFLGKCHVAYISSGKVIGLSILARIVDVFSHRLQIQEILTVQIAETIKELTNAQSVGVIIEAKHLCMIMRDVEKQNSLMKISTMLGLFRKSSATRNEFLSLLSIKS